MVMDCVIFKLFLRVIWLTFLMTHFSDGASSSFLPPLPPVLPFSSILLFSSSSPRLLSHVSKRLSFIAINVVIRSIASPVPSITLSASLLVYSHLIPK